MDIMLIIIILVFGFLFYESKQNQARMMKEHKENMNKIKQDKNEA